MVALFRELFERPSYQCSENKGADQLRNNPVFLRCGSYGNRLQSVCVGNPEHRMS